MSQCFADTFYYVALLSTRDDAHERAVHVNRRLKGRLVTTQWVLTEVGDALCRPEHRALFLRLMRILESDPDTLIVPADAALFRRGVTRFAERPDKDWPLTDCISFVVMEERGLTDALTGDHHFEQAGFRALLR